MEQNEQPQTPTQDGGLTYPLPELLFPANVRLPVNIMADTTDYYLLTRDKIENLKAGTDSDESTMFGVGAGVCGAIVGILIPLYLTGSPEMKGSKLVWFLWALFIAFAVLTLYFFRKWRALKNKREAQFADILAKSKTIVTLASPSEPKRLPPS